MQIGSISRWAAVTTALVFSACDCGETTQQTDSGLDAALADRLDSDTTNPDIQAVDAHANDIGAPDVVLPDTGFADGHIDAASEDSATTTGDAHTVADATPALDAAQADGAQMDGGATMVPVELTIVETAGQAQSNRFLSSGVSLAEADSIQTTNNLRITDHLGQTVPAQFAVLSRYNGAPTDSSKPIRVVFCTFAATFPAAGEATYYLRNDGGGTVAGDDLATEDNNHMTIDTGAMTLLVKKGPGFNLFDRVTVDGVNLIDTPNNDGIVISANSTLYTSALDATAPAISVEHNGPLMAVVRVDGRVVDASGNPLISTSIGNPSAVNGMTYSVWIKCYKDSKTAIVTVTLKNQDPGQCGYGDSSNKNVRFDHMYLRTTLAGLGAPSAVRFDGWEDTSAPTGSYSIEQTHQSNQASEADDLATPNFTYSIKEGTQERATGRRYDGYAQLGDGSNGLLVANRWFWQNWPKAIHIDASQKQIDYHLWPDIGEPHVFLGAAWKTHTMLFHFSADTSAIAGEVATLKQAARVFPANTAQTDFLDLVPPGQMETAHIFSGGESLDLAIAAWNNTIRAKFDASFSTNSSASWDWTDLRENRPYASTDGAFDGPIDWYGWLNFGDGVRGTGTWGLGSLNYGWLYISGIHGLRFYDSQMMEMADQMAQVYADRFIVHAPIDDNTTVQAAGAKVRDIHGAHRGESDGTTAARGWTQGLLSDSHTTFGKHSWIRGAILHYLRTADPVMRDALQDIGDHILWNYSNKPLSHGLWGPRDDSSVKNCVGNVCTFWHQSEIRKFARTMGYLAHLYQLTGDTNYLDASAGIFENALLHMEVQIANQRMGILDNDLNLHLFNETLAIKESIITYHVLEQAGHPKAAEVREWLLRLLQWFETMQGKWNTATCGTYGTGPNSGSYFPFQTRINLDDWPNNNWDDSTGHWDKAYSFVSADLYAFGYHATGDISYLEKARHIFKDFWYYEGNGNWETINTTAPRSSGFPNGGAAAAWLKVGKVLEKPMYYLWVEAQQ